MRRKDWKNSNYYKIQQLNMHDLYLIIEREKHHSLPIEFVRETVLNV